LHRNCLGGWPAFVVSLLVIAGLTALVEQVILVITFQVNLLVGINLPISVIQFSVPNAKIIFILEGSQVAQW